MPLKSTVQFILATLLLGSELSIGFSPNGLHRMTDRSFSSLEMAQNENSGDKPTALVGTKKLAPSTPNKTPRRFYVAPGNLGPVATSSVQFAFRLGSGALTYGWRPSLVKDEDPSRYSLFRGFGTALQESSSIEDFPRPEKSVELYEFEGCPFCRKVREAVSILDLDVLFYPCPQGGPNFRVKAMEMGGKKQFPYMVDPNTGTSMYESDDIIAYLFEKYGGGAANVPSSLAPGIATTLACGLGMLPRMGAGSRFEETKKSPKQPLVYWGYEASPFCKIVRERLNELELPHLQRSCARGSSKRQELLDKTGFFQAPYLEDPNTGAAMFESKDIIEYLDQTYALV